MQTILLLLGAKACVQTLAWLVFNTIMPCYSSNDDGRSFQLYHKIECCCLQGSRQFGLHPVHRCEHRCLLKNVYVLHSQKLSFSHFTATCLRSFISSKTYESTVVLHSGIYDGSQACVLYPPSKSSAPVYCFFLCLFCAPPPRLPPCSWNRALSIPLFLFERFPQH